MSKIVLGSRGTQIVIGSQIVMGVQNCYGGLKKLQFAAYVQFVLVLLRAVGVAVAEGEAVRRMAAGGTGLLCELTAQLCAEMEAGAYLFC